MREERNENIEAGFFLKHLGSFSVKNIFEMMWNIDKHFISLVEYLRANTMTSREYHVNR